MPLEFSRTMLGMDQPGGNNSYELISDRLDNDSLVLVSFAPAPSYSNLQVRIRFSDDGQNYYPAYGLRPDTRRYDLLGTLTTIPNNTARQYLMDVRGQKFIDVTFFGFNGIIAAHGYSFRPPVPPVPPGLNPHLLPPTGGSPRDQWGY